MKCAILWHGGSNYSVPDVRKDVEYCDSLKDAIHLHQNRCDFDPYFPCVDDLAAETQVFFGYSPEDPLTAEHGDPYPDRVIRNGPRGGVLISRG